MFKLSFYVPVSHVDVVKDALFETGAGRIGDYEHCCWQTLGEGQFKPLKGSQPHIGELGKLEKVAEYKVELVCDSSNIKSAITALRRSHPYEEPAYDIVQLVDLDKVEGKL
ncbi:NGG1p interacting factor NIF3 [Aurantivibrio infirmus]